MSKLSKQDDRWGCQAEIRAFEGLSRIEPHAAGADIGAHEIVVCVPGAEGTQMVRTFGNYTSDLQAMARWLVEQAVQSIATESTAVYWIPLFEVLKAQGLKCCLISATAIRRFPGRKSDGLDCQWIQTCPAMDCWLALFDRRRT